MSSKIGHVCGKDCLFHLTEENKTFKLHTLWIEAQRD